MSARAAPGARWLSAALLSFIACDAPERAPVASVAARAEASAARAAAPEGAARPEGARSGGTTRAGAAVPALRAVPESWRFPLELGSVSAARYLVTTESAHATRAAVDVLADGGNAFDAAVAAAFVLAVTYPQAGNVGGGGFALLRAPDGALAALDFRETAPRAAHKEMFLAPDGSSRRSRGDTEEGEELEDSKASHRAAGVPGSVAGLWALHARYGSRPWASLLARAIELAEQGFEVDAEHVRSSEEALPRLRRYRATQALFLRDGRPLPERTLLENPDLARALRRIAEQGKAGFYAGETAQLIVSEMQRGGGLIDAQDLAAYEPRWLSPVEFEYRGHRVVSMPPPSSGGVALALIANVLEPYPLAELGWHSPEHLHLLAEAMTRAFADRNALLGDPDFVEVPLAELMSEAYADRRRASIGEQATPAERVAPGLPPPEGHHTTHLAVVDADGAAVALTTTINDLYGSGVTVTGAGFLLNNEMDDFTARPGVPNTYGLVQGEANAVAPGKRMLSSMAPTLVLDAEGRVRIVAGARGGPRIISATWQVVSNVIDFGFDAAAAVNAPRVHHQWRPDEIVVEASGLGELTEQALVARGHRIRHVGEIANAPAIVRDAERLVWVGIADPRRGGAALGE